VLLEGVEKASAYEVIWGQWRVVMASHQNFSATDSALGYLYQFRLALWSSLQKCRKNKSFSVYLETLDDVVFESNDFSVELLQLKHHRNHAENLSDSSSDLWKSFRVWIEGRTNNSIPGDAQLYLITTSKISAKSLASYLTLEDRNEAEALKKLQKIASTSTTKKMRFLTNYSRISLATSKQLCLDLLQFFLRCLISKKLTDFCVMKFVLL
jgi:hypothetical protein